MSRQRRWELYLVVSGRELIVGSYVSLDELCRSMNLRIENDQKLYPGWEGYHVR